VRRPDPYAVPCPEKYCRAPIGERCRDTRKPESCFYEQSFKKRAHQSRRAAGVVAFRTYRQIPSTGSDVDVGVTSSQDLQASDGAGSRAVTCDRGRRGGAS
jgi:hypothetical protein